MAKQVYSHDEIPHLWAHQKQDSARTSNGTLYFNGPSIYSSHFEIARLVENNDGSNAVLFTTRTHSNTTAGHKSMVLSSVSHKNIIYCAYPTDGVEWDADHKHQKNFASFLHEMESQADNLKRARKPQKYINAIEEQYNLAVKYAEYFNIEVPTTITAALAITNSDGYAEYQANKEKFLAEEKKKADEALRIKIEKGVKEWKKFKHHRLYTRLDQDYLRYNKSKHRIETSQGIEVPYEIAKKFYLEIVSVVDKGGCDNCQNKILDYSVKKINKHGIKVGCHAIKMKEIKAMAKKLGW